MGQGGSPLSALGSLGSETTVETGDQGDRKEPAEADGVKVLLQTVVGPPGPDNGRTALAN